MKLSISCKQEITIIVKPFQPIKMCLKLPLTVHVDIYICPDEMVFSSKRITIAVKPFFLLLKLALG